MLALHVGSTLLPFCNFFGAEEALVDVILTAYLRSTDTLKFSVGECLFDFSISNFTQFLDLINGTTDQIFGAASLHVKQAFVPPIDFATKQTFVDAGGDIVVILLLLISLFSLPLSDSHRSGSLLNFLGDGRAIIASRRKGSEPKGLVVGGAAINEVIRRCRLYDANAIKWHGAVAAVIQYQLGLWFRCCASESDTERLFVGSCHGVLDPITGLEPSELEHAFQFNIICDIWAIDLSRIGRWSRCLIRNDYQAVIRIDENAFGEHGWATRTHVVEAVAVFHKVFRAGNALVAPVEISWTALP